MNKLLEIAFSQYGIKEIPGKANNPEVVKYFREIGQTRITNDETAWCSAFINWCAKKAGLEMSNILTARSWLSIGKKKTKAELGDVLIFWRENINTWKGHVGIFINEDDTYYWVLGGNQSNSVCIKKYPKYRLLGIRQLNKI